MIYVCADDYGVMENADRRIKECVENGALNKISVFPNGAYEPDLAFDKKDLQLSLHINLVEGKALSKPETIGLLVSKDGYFKNSFTGLLLLSLTGKRKKFEKQLYEEIKAQIEWWLEKIPSGKPILIDSHQHTHMIPSVFKIMMKVIADENVEVKYLRLPAEPILPFLRSPSLYFTYSPVNVIKQWLLRFLEKVNRKEYKKYKIPTAYFMGILFSGKMDSKRVLNILPHYKKLADKNNMDIEILFHPGYMEEGEKLGGKRKKTFENFYFSKGRKTEFNTVKKLKLIMKEESINAVY